MPRLNFYIILFAVAVYFGTSWITLRDRLLVGTLHYIERNAYVKPSEKFLFEGAMIGMMFELSDKFGDGYSHYIPPNKEKRYRDELDNRYDGLGFRSKHYDEGTGKKKFFIEYPFRDSPAYRAGIRSGDQILEVNGTPLDGKTYSEIINLLKQKNKNGVVLSVLPFGQEEPKEIMVQPDRIHCDSVEGDCCDEAGQRLFFLETEPQIGYIRITSFSETTAKEFAAALDQVVQSDAKGLILDLRNNPGGYIDSCIKIARMLMQPKLNQDIIVTTKYRHHEQVHRLTEGTQRCTLPMVVLINGQSASSSEILTAALQDYHRATVVGMRSFGKGVVQNITPLPFNSGLLQLTGASYWRPSGKNIHRKKDAPDSGEWGVTPEKIVELSETENEAVILFRLLRSNVLSPNRKEVLEQLHQRIVQEVRKEESNENFDFTGTSPYYDPQLNEAVKILIDE